MSSRQKSKSQTDIPLLPKAVEIMAKYKNDPICIQRKSVLPVRSNQKMNEYLKEIAEICEITTNLNTHKARRTFASTVTLNNAVPIHVVKEMLGHYSVKQTEDYAITEQEVIGREMKELEFRLRNGKSSDQREELKKMVEELESGLYSIVNIDALNKDSNYQVNIVKVQSIIDKINLLFNNNKQ